MKTLYAKVFLVFALAVSAYSATCQVATGTYSHGTFDALGIDTINVGNLNTHITFPVFQDKYSQRMPFFYNLTYDNSIWYPTTPTVSKVWTPTKGFGWSSDSYEPALGNFDYEKEVSFTSGSGTSWYYTITESNFVYRDLSGSLHAFNATISAQCGMFNSTDISCVHADSTLPQSATISDGNGYTLTVSIQGSGSSTNWGTAASITTSSGTTYLPFTEYDNDPNIIDKNGNIVSFSTSGSTTTITSNSSVLTISGDAPADKVFTYNTYAGINNDYDYQSSVVVHYKTYTIQTAFGCSGIGEYGPIAQSLVDSITYSDGSVYHFSYENTPGVSGNVTGRLSGVQVPQGGWIHYSYTGGSNGNGIECSDGSTTVLTRTMDGDTGSAATSLTYSRSITGSGTSQTSVMDGLSNNKIYNFVATDYNAIINANTHYYETTRNVYQGAASGTPVQAKTTCYNGNTASCATAFFTLPITQIDTFNTLDGLQTNGATEKIDSNSGYVTEVDTYDFGGATSRGALLTKRRLSVSSFGDDQHQAYTCFAYTSDITYDGNNNVVAKTTNTYDSVAPTEIWAPQNDMSFGSHCNLNQQTTYINSISTQSQSFTYYSPGNIMTSTTPLGTTSYSYNSNFNYPQTITYPAVSNGTVLASNTASFGGLPAISTDVNGQQVIIPSYDQMQRPTEVDYPDGGKATFTYSPTQMGQHNSISGDTEVQFDAYGRSSRTAVANGQNGNGWYQQDNCYGANGNLSFSSYPYQGTGFGTSKVCSGSGDTYSYDALGRLTSMVRANGETTSYSYLGRATKVTDANGVTRISQIDGLGRTTVVCEVSSNSNMPNSGSPANCGTDIAGTGFTTNYSYDLANHMTTVTQGVQSRIFQTDWIGRTIFVQEPESGSTSYSYAYNNIGLVVTRQKPRANQNYAWLLTTTTTQYDTLGRILSVNYDDGTPTKTFTYDTSSNWSNFSQNNLLGRLSSASTPNTETVYSYDSMGRVTDMAECTPSMCSTTNSNKQLHYTYDLAGNLHTSTDAAGTTSTYTVSSANEILSIASSLSNAQNPANILSNVQYGPNGPISYNLGNGLMGINTYDSLGRLNLGYVSTSGGYPVYQFNTTWTGNQLTYAADTSDNMSANYGYDEFGRLSSQTVLSGGWASLSFIYDRYGNRTQQNATSSGYGGYQPQFSFNQTNNQVTGYTYDAAGNMTNGGYYTYDAEGNLISEFGINYVYNALNQLISNSAGGVESIYNIFGQRDSEWSSGSLLKGHYYWGSKPLALYDTSSTYFRHQDWLGTDRVRTDYTGAVVQNTINMPFGDGYDYGGGGDLGSANNFAMLDFDTTSWTYRAQHRQYDGTTGRFMSPDPYSGSYNLSNPQSMNRYTYAMNSPLSNIDPSGYDACAYDNGNGTATIINAEDGGAVNCPGNGFYIVTDQQVTNVGFFTAGEQDGNLALYVTDGNNFFNPDGSPFDSVTSVTVNGGTDYWGSNFLPMWAIYVPNNRLVVVAPPIAPNSPAPKKSPLWEVRVTNYQVQGCYVIPGAPPAPWTQMCSAVKTCGENSAAGPDVTNTRTNGIVAPQYLVRFEYDILGHQIPFVGEAYYPSSQGTSCSH